MKKTNYICDVCGNDIVPKNRHVNINGSMIKSCYESYIRLEVKQIATKDGRAERTADIDLCDDCYNKISDILKKECKNT